MSARQQKRALIDVVNVQQVLRVAPPPSALRPPICGVQRVRQIYLDVFSDVMPDSRGQCWSPSLKWQEVAHAGRKWLTQTGSGSRWQEV